jgi:hypothetical protein
MAQLHSSGLGSTPIRSILSLPLFIREHSMTALNLYTDRAAEGEVIGLAFAADAGAAVHIRRGDEQIMR